jgi:hypothetical protein
MLYLEEGKHTMATLPKNGAGDNLLLKYFSGERVHPGGKTIHESLNMNGPRIGNTGGVIQWLFPLTTPSTHVPRAPTLSPFELKVFRTDPELRELYLVGVNRFLERFGISVHGNSGSIEPDFNTRKKWMYPSYHAFMPVTRILRSLKLLGFPDEFATLLKILLLCNKRCGGDRIDRTTLDIWEHL